MTAQGEAAAAIGVGLVGASVERGWAKSAHVPAIRRVRGLELRGISTRRRSTADAGAREWGLNLAFTDHRRLIERPEIDLVVVAVKVPDHFQIVSDALDAGKMVYSEWPLGRDLAEVVELEAHARSVHARTVIGLQGRMAPAARYMRDLLAQGVVGRPLSTSLRGHAPGDEWIGRLSAEFEFVKDRANGATVLSVAAGHALEPFIHALGDFVSASGLSVRRREAEISVAGVSAISDMPDEALIVGQLESGMPASIHFSGGGWSRPDVVWEVLGDEGAVVVEVENGYLHLDEAVVRVLRHGEAERELPVPPRYSGGFPGLTGPSANVTRLYERFVTDLGDGATETPDFSVALRRHQLLHAIETSAR